MNKIIQFPGVTKAPYEPAVQNTEKKPSTRKEFLDLMEEKMSEDDFIVFMKALIEPAYYNSSDEDMQSLVHGYYALAK